MTSRDGHRDEYLRLFTTIFGLEHSVGKIFAKKLHELIVIEKLFFGSIDDDYFGFIVVAIIRAARGKRTVGLFLRPQTCFRNGTIYHAKKLVFILLKRSKRIKIFTIVPHTVAPEYAQVADGGLFDPQMWDKLGEDASPDHALISRIRNSANGRRILAFVGTATSIKGIEFALKILAEESWATNDIMLVVAGRFPNELKSVVDELENLGALVISRYISESELESVYEASDLIWSCYRPVYDQASGIFGRALQHSKTPVVRAGSLIANLAKHLKIETIELNFGASSDAAKKLVAKELTLGKIKDDSFELWKQGFIEKIGKAL